jgi:hypothetical protein
MRIIISSKLPARREVKTIHPSSYKGMAHRGNPILILSSLYRLLNYTAYKIKIFTENFTCARIHKEF